MKIFFSHQLAELCYTIENIPECIENLEEARKVARREHLMSQLRRIHCLIGRARGQLDFCSFGESLIQFSQQEI